MPIAELLTEGTDADADVELVIATGPDHEYAVTLDGLFAVSVSVPPMHRGELLLALANDGTAFTVTVVVYSGLEQPEPALLTVTE